MSARVTSYTPLHDEVEAEVARLADDATVFLSAGRLRALVHEARAVEDDVLTDWMEATDPCQIA